MVLAIAAMENKEKKAAERLIDRIKIIRDRLDQIPHDERWTEAARLAIIHQNGRKAINRNKMSEATFKKGDLVVYVGNPHREPERGIVFSDSDPDMATVPVVYNCGGEWGAFDQYTPARTLKKDLVKGWDLTYKKGE